MNGGKTNTDYVMSKESDKIVDFTNIQLVSSLPNFFTFNKMGKIINAAI